MTLSDYAPGNVFYAEQRRVGIQGIEFDSTQLEPWRFCLTAPTMSCGWKAETSSDSPLCTDRGQVLDLLRVTTVFAQSSDSEIRVNDEVENRNPKQFVRQIFFYPWSREGRGGLDDLEQDLWL